MQLANKAYGGTVVKGGEREDGQHEIIVEVDSLLYAGMEVRTYVDHTCMRYCHIR